MDDRLPNSSSDLPSHTECCILCPMKRCTVNIPEPSTAADLFKTVTDPTSELYRTLSEVVAEGQPLISESAVALALMQIGLQTLQERRLTAQYTRAVANGELDDEETLQFMRHARHTGARMAAEDL